MDSKKWFETMKEAVSGVCVTDGTKPEYSPGCPEIELKIDIENYRQIGRMIDLMRSNALCIGPAKEKDREHWLFAENAAVHHSVIKPDEAQRAVSDDHMRIRSKSRGLLTRTPGGLSVYVRPEVKALPGSPEYIQRLQMLCRCELAGRFRKRAVVSRVWLDDLAFAAELSLVDCTYRHGAGKPQHHQFELEYKGCRPGTEPPNLEQILATLDRALPQIFGEGKASTSTRLEWILEGTPDKDKYCPPYVETPLKDACQVFEEELVLGRAADERVTTPVLR
jgi:hypothetical protein